MTDIEQARKDRLRKRAKYLISLTPSLDVTIEPEKDLIELNLKNTDGTCTRVGGPWKLLGVNHDTGKVWPLALAEFDAFQALCEFVAPLGYSHAEIAEAWEMVREDVMKANEDDRMKCN